MYRSTCLHLVDNLLTLDLKKALKFLSQELRGFSFNFVQSRFKSVNFCQRFFLFHDIVEQGSQTRGPRAGCGPPNIITWPALQQRC